jgi:acyl dehydratase
MPYPMIGQYFDEYTVGQTFKTHGRTLTEADLVNYCGVIGDYEPPHADEEFAKSTPLKRRVMQGGLVTTAAEGLMSRSGLFDVAVITLLAAAWEYRAPVFIGDTIHVTLTVKETKPSSKGGRGVVTFVISIRNQADAEVVAGNYVMMVKTA